MDIAPNAVRIRGGHDYCRVDVMVGEGRVLLPVPAAPLTLALPKGS